MNAPRLLAKPLEEARRVVDLAGGLEVGLSLLGREEPGKLVAPRNQRRRRALQNLAAPGGRELAPATPGAGRPLDRRRDAPGIGTPHLGEQSAGGRIADSEPVAAAVTRLPPGAIDPRGGLEPKRGADFHDQ